MKFHLGSIIKKKVESLNMGPTELARKIHTSKQNVYAIYKRESIDTILLFKLCKILKVDFFKICSEQISTNDLNSLTPEQKIIFQEREIELLKEVIEVYKKKS